MKDKYAKFHKCFDNLITEIEHLRETDILLRSNFPNFLKYLKWKIDMRFGQKIE